MELSTLFLLGQIVREGKCAVKQVQFSNNFVKNNVPLLSNSFYYEAPKPENGYLK